MSISFLNVRLAIGVIKFSYYYKVSFDRTPEYITYTLNLVLFYNALFCNKLKKRGVSILFDRVYISLFYYISLLIYA